jgi:transcriptional regulator with XRE-family HTH domain
MIEDGASCGRIVAAREAAGLSQRQLAVRSGVAQTTLSRIEQGVQLAKMNEVLALASALGCAISQLTGRSSVEDRLECVPCGADHSMTEKTRRELSHYLELDAYLEDQGISSLL